MPRFLSFIFLVILLGLSACKDKNPTRGKAFLPHDTFVSVLVDIHLVDGVTNDRSFYRKYENVDSIDVLGPILEKYEVSRQMFDTTMKVYVRHPDLFDEVYNEVIMRLNIMLDELSDEEEKRIEEASRKALERDSLMRDSLRMRLLSDSTVMNKLQRDSIELDSLFLDSLIMDSLRRSVASQRPLQIQE